MVFSWGQQKDKFQFGGARQLNENTLGDRK